MRKILYIVIILTACIACKPGIPSDVLSEGTMVDVLYDMHIAQAMADNDDAVLKNRKDVIALRASILEKHGISRQEWDRSFLFYCGHADYMHEIYQDLEERLDDEVVALGGKAQGMTDTEEEDSTNIWNQESSIVLWQDVPYNRVTFNVVPDSTFHDGDRINLQYETQLLFQDGMRDITVCMNVYYDRSKESKPDSICTRINHIASDGNGIVSLSNDVDRLKVKRITGFFFMAKPGMQPEEMANKSLVFRLAAIRNIRLLHQHTLPPAPATSSTATTNMRDSLNKDSLQKINEQEDKHKEQEGGVRLFHSGPLQGGPGPHRNRD